jgi:hypothetical protein
MRYLWGQGRARRAGRSVGVGGIVDAGSVGWVCVDADVPFVPVVPFVWVDKSELFVGPGLT